MKIKRILALTLLLCTAFSFASCINTEDVELNAAVCVTDMIGRKVEVLPGSYKRVVCIGAGALRMYSYIGDISLLCGVEDIDNVKLEERPKMFDSSARPYVMTYAEEFSKLKSCGVGGPNVQTAESEKILSCEPDIIISEYGDADKENALSAQTGVPVITLKSGPEGVFANEFKESLKLLGYIFAKEERANELLSFVESETKELQKRTKDIPDDEKPYVYIAGLGNWGTASHLTTAEKYSTFYAVNVKNAVSGLGMKGIGTIEEEKFISAGENADIMIIDSAAVKNIKPMYDADPSMFDTVKAWKNGEVYLQMTYNAYYTNYETALADAWFVGKTVYPERFSDIDIKDKLNEITKVFLGKKLADEIYAFPASFGGYQKIDTETFFK